MGESPEAPFLWAVVGGEHESGKVWPEHRPLSGDTMTLGRLEHTPTHTHTRAPTHTRKPIHHLNKYQWLLYELQKQKVKLEQCHICAQSAAANNSQHIQTNAANAKFTSWFVLVTVIPLGYSQSDFSARSWRCVNCRKKKPQNKTKPSNTNIYFMQETNFLNSN